MEKMQMTRALQKHVARRQDQTFADWFAEFKELTAGERWADVADQAPTIFAVWGGGDARASFVHGGADTAAKDSGGIEGSADGKFSTQFAEKGAESFEHCVSCGREHSQERG
jgi:hypothetical protein